MVTVPPRMGWSKNNAHHDTIRFSLLYTGMEDLAKDHEGLAENCICKDVIHHDPIRLSQFFLEDDLDLWQGSASLGVGERGEDFRVGGARVEKGGDRRPLIISKLTGGLKTKKNGEKVFGRPLIISKLKLNLNSERKLR